MSRRLPSTGGTAGRQTHFQLGERAGTATFGALESSERPNSQSIDQPDLNFLWIKSEFGQRDRKAKSARTDAAGVNVENTTLSINAGLVGVP